MTDFSKYDMTDIWASAGDVVAPDSAKIAAGWGVEVVPRQWWNWFENRQDNNIAYLLQKGIPEWDSTTEYQINKSFVQLGGIVYKALTTNTNIDPSTSLTDWARAFADYSTSSAALGGLTLAANTFPYFTSTTAAATTPLTPFARTILDDADAATVRTTISAQTLNTNLTALAGVAPAVNALPYFNSGTTMAVTTMTAFGRSLLDDVDAPTARATLGVYSILETDTAISASAATLQPLDATLTTLAALTTATNTMPYFTGVDTAAVTSLTAFARTLLGDADAATARTTLGVPAIADVQPVDATLTALAGLSTSANTMPYFTGVDAVTTTPLTIFARSLLDDADAATARTTLGAQTLDATLTALAGVTTAADTLIYATGVDAFTTTSLTAYGRSLIGAVDAPAARTTLGLGNAAVRDVTAAGRVIAEDSPTGAAQVTRGTTAQRPAVGIGKFRYNTDTNRFEGSTATNWGSLGGATGGGNDDAFYENTTTITSSYTITTGKNAMSAGPITIADGATVTIPDGSTWSIV